MKKRFFSLPINSFSIDDSQSDLVPVRIQICHDRENPNGSYFELDSFKKAQKSLENKPIVAAYEINDENEKENFKGHEVEYKVIDNNGKIEIKVVYIEQPIGAIPETNDYSIEEIEGYNWIVVNGYLYKNYCEEAINIIKENNGNKKVSMEIDVIDGYQDDKDGFYHIKDFKFLGITVLGDEDIYSPAMGSNSEISLFSKTQQPKEFAMQFSKILEEINKRGDKKMTKKSTNGKKDFTLSSNDLENRIREKLSKFTYEYTYSWGETETLMKYWLRDVIIGDSIVVVEDTTEYKNYGIPFVINNDEVELKVEESVRYIRGDWRAFVDGTDKNEASESIEIFNNIIEKEKEHFTNEIKEIKESFMPTETEEYKELNEKFTTLQTENNELIDFKTRFELEEREKKEVEIFEKYKELETLDGFAEIKEKVREFSIEELENKLLLLFAKKSFTAKKITKETSALKVEEDFEQVELSEAQKRYGRNL